MAKKVKSAPAKKATPAAPPTEEAVEPSPVEVAVEKWSIRAEEKRKRAATMDEKIQLLIEYLDRRHVYTLPFVECAQLLDSRRLPAGGPVSAALDALDEGTLDRDTLYLALVVYVEQLAEGVDTPFEEYLQLNVLSDVDLADDGEPEAADDVEEQELEDEPEPEPVVSSNGKSSKKKKAVAAKPEPEPEPALVKKPKAPKIDEKGRQVIYRPPGSTKRVVRGTVMASSPTRVSLKDERGHAWTNIDRALIEFVDDGPTVEAEADGKRAPIVVEFPVPAKRLQQMKEMLRGGKPMSKLEEDQPIPAYSFDFTFEPGQGKPAVKFYLDLINGKKRLFVDIFARRMDKTDKVYSHEPIFEGPEGAYRLEVRNRIFDVRVVPAE